MNDKKYEQIKKKLKRLVSKWRHVMVLNSYRLDFVWDRSYCRQAGVAAEVKCSWTYKTILITFYLPEIEQLTDDEIEGVVVHELSHVLLHPVAGDPNDDQPDFNQKVEYATTCVAQAVQWAYEAGQRVRTGRESSGDKPDGSGSRDE